MKLLPTVLFIVSDSDNLHPRCYFKAAILDRRSIEFCAVDICSSQFSSHSHLRLWLTRTFGLRADMV